MGAYGESVRWFMAGGIVFFSYEWFENARGSFDALILVIALDLGMAFLFILLTEPRDGKLRGVSRLAAQSAARHGLGHWVLGVRWTNWRYLLPALIVIDMTVPVARLVVTPPGIHAFDIVWVAVVLTPAAVWLRRVVIGAGRRVHELVDAAVWLPTAPARVAHEKLQD